MEYAAINGEVWTVEAEDVHSGWRWAWFSLLSPAPSPRIPSPRTEPREPSLRSPGGHHADMGHSLSLMSPWLPSSRCSCLRSCASCRRAHVTDPKLPIALHQSRDDHRKSRLCHGFILILRISAQTFSCSYLFSNSYFQLKSRKQIKTHCGCSCKKYIKGKLLLYFTPQK